MANVRLNCPTCNAELEIGDEHLGKEVECGSCLGAFVAEDPATKKKPYKMRRTEREDRDDEEDDRPRKKKRRRRRDEDDDYDYSPPGTGGGEGGGSSAAIFALILGIISLVFSCCWCFGLPISIAGIICGIVGMGHPNGKPMATIGLVLSGLALLLSGGIGLLGMAPGFAPNFR